MRSRFRFQYNISTKINESPQRKHFPIPSVIFFVFQLPCEPIPITFNNIAVRSYKFYTTSHPPPNLNCTVSTVLCTSLSFDMPRRCNFWSLLSVTGCVDRLVGRSSVVSEWGLDRCKKEFLCHAVIANSCAPLTSP